MAVVSLRLLSFICFFGILISQTTAQPSFNYYFCINDKGNYTANSTYQTNLNTLLSNLSSNTQIDYGFYNFSHGQNSDQVNAIGLCRGDVKPYDCRSCLSDSRVLLTQLCPNQKEAIGWYDNCMLRYSNRSIFGVMEASPAFYMWNINNATEVDQFNQVLTNLLGGLRSKAASGDSLRKFVAANATGPSFQTIYGLVQCTPDLSEQECTDCLVGAISEIPECCDSKIGGRVVRPSCNIRYENYYFLEPTADAAPPQVSPPPPPPSTNSKSTEGKSNTSRTVIAVVVPVVAFVLLLIFICIYLRLRKPSTKFESEAETDNDTKLTDSNQFEFRTIQVATNNFSDANKLGQGGFGPVYKGRLSNGQEVAIKRLSRTSGQGDNEFKNEVLLMAKLQHRNLVRLHGFCLEEKERILLYEFLPNKSLDYFIFDPIKRAQLDWKKRYKIIEGITRGLLYLHEDSQLRIIHRDLKVSNILLDAEMNPKISDFGMAKLFDVDQTQGNTSRIAGTYGYMAPEYAIHGRFSIKSDVFSFGVLVLEIISGKKNRGSCNEENVEHLLSIAWKNWRQGTASRIVDPTLDVGSRNEIMRCIQIGLLCVQEKAVDRPTLASVLLMLEGHYVSLPVPSRPAFFMKNTTLSETDIYSGASFVDAPRNEISITELYPR